MRSPADSRAYFVVLPRGAGSRPEAAKFSLWLQQQAKDEDADAASAVPVREKRTGRRGE
jgi:hypothetical protein